MQWHHDHTLPYPAGARLARAGGDLSVASYAEILVLNLAGTIDDCTVTELAGHQPVRHLQGSWFTSAVGGSLSYPTVPAGTAAVACWLPTNDLHNGDYRITVRYNNGSVPGEVGLTVQIRNAVLLATFGPDLPHFLIWDPLAGDTTGRRYKFRIADAAKRPVSVDFGYYALHRLEIEDPPDISSPLNVALEHEYATVWTSGDWTDPVEVNGAWDGAVTPPWGGPATALPGGAYAWNVRLGYDGASGWGLDALFSDALRIGCAALGDPAQWAYAKRLSDLDGSNARFLVDYDLNSLPIDDDGSGSADDDQPETAAADGYVVVLAPDGNQVWHPVRDLACRLHGTCDGLDGPHLRHQLEVPAGDCVAQGRYTFVVAAFMDVHAAAHRGHATRPALVVGQTYTVCDLDLDSDNSGAFDAPSGSASEEAFEDQPSDQRPGKLIVVQDHDLDGDAIPDWVDGYNLEAGYSADDTCEGLQFVPLVIRGAALPATARLRLTYPAADPRRVEPTLTAPFVRTDEPRLRLWRRDGSAVRDGRALLTGGDWVAPGEYTAAQLGAVNQDTTLYIEAIEPSASVGDAVIRLELDPLGDGRFDGADEVRLTCQRLRVETCQNSADALVGNRYLTAPTDDPQLATYSSADLLPGPRADVLLRVFDPRRNITGLQIGSLTAPLAWDEAANSWTTTLVPMPADGSGGDQDGLPVPPENGPPAFALPKMALPLGPVSIDLLANAEQGAAYGTCALGGGVRSALASLGTRLGIPTMRADFVVAGEVLKAVELAELDPGFPADPVDTGSLGKYASSHLRQQLEPYQRFQCNIVVDRETRVVYAIDGVNMGNRTVHTEIDVVYLRPGATRFQVGDIWDPDRVQQFYEVRNSVSGGLSAIQRERLQNLSGGRPIMRVHGTKRRYNYTQQCWEDNPRFRKALRLLDAIGLARTAWNTIHASQFADELEEILDTAEDIAADTSGDPFDRRVRVVTELLPPMKDYLSHFCPDSQVTDAQMLIVAYRLLALD
ncbi:MAG: hypothetical protein IT204_11185 [Fimbriimonadaceae bacterium]|nr:hypothetical protein [Fimbriimonadaceae bacterium]